MILLNNFHNTKTSVRATDGTLSAAQTRRCKKQLCGVENCTCSNEAGMRGPGNPIIIFDEESRGFIEE
jgi:hypothetical protein